MSYNLQEVIKEAKESASKRANNGTEVKVMQAMLNDKNFKIGVYQKGKGKVDEISMYETSRSLLSNVLQNAANISATEADNLSNNYEFDKKDASNFIAISKEFTNQYVTTGKKMNLGEREHLNVSLAFKEVPSREKQVPVGALGSGSKETKTVTMDAYNSLKVSGKNLY